MLNNYKGDLEIIYQPTIRKLIKNKKVNLVQNTQHLAG